MRSEELTQAVISGERFALRRGDVCVDHRRPRLSMDYAPEIITVQPALNSISARNTLESLPLVAFIK